LRFSTNFRAGSEVAALTGVVRAVMLKSGASLWRNTMLPRFAAVTLLVLAASLALNPAAAQQLQSGPKADENLPGSFQTLNLNGAFADRFHCLVCEFRLNPVALVFVRSQQDAVDPEVKKLLEALDKVADERHGDTGFDTFVVFLTPQSRSGATEEKFADPETAIQEAVNREKLLSGLREFAKPFKRLIVTATPVESVAAKYHLADKAEVTVLVYANLRVYANLAFAQDQLKQDGIDAVLKAVDTTFDRLKKAPALAK
jgi:hypothetical protein